LYTAPELSHGRIDIRGVRHIPVTPLQVNFPCIWSIAEIHRKSTDKKTDKRTSGQRIYLSSRHGEPPAQILRKIRDRWSVENKNHHPRDSTMLEDKCRCRTRHTAANLALLRGIGLKIWKKSKPKRTAPDFIRSNRKDIDALIALTKRNQRLTKME
jgi:predicted transposase YbfD/YdcC